jgi:hypothetical protein
MKGRSVDADDLAPQTVFEGDAADAAFLNSLLASGGIEAQLVAPVRWGIHRLVVRRVDAPDARAVIADWHRNREGR